jgi:hypothetical protein
MPGGCSVGQGERFILKVHHRTLRATLATAGVFAVPMVTAPAALAHHVGDKESTAKCELVGDVPTITLNVKFIGFTNADKVNLDGTIWVDGAEVKKYDDLTWAGSNYTLVYTRVSTAGPHTIKAKFTWKTQGSMNGTTTKTVECPAPPETPPTTPPETPPTTPETPPTTPPETPPSTPPATTPPATTTPPPVAPVSVTPTNVTPPAATPPAGGVLPATVVSGRARVSGPSGCVRQAFRARVTGRSIASVTFYVDGKMVKRFRGARGSYSIKVNPRRYGVGRHRVAAAVTFAAESGTRARRLPLTFRRCARGAVAPRFTG